MQPHLLKGEEATRHIITVLRPQQAIESVSQSADHRRRKHIRQLDEAITTERFALGSLEAVGGFEFESQLFIASGLHVGESRAGHQRPGRIVVLRQRHVPVPPVLIVTCPLLVDAAVTIGLGKRRPVRLHIHSSATS